MVRLSVLDRKLLRQFRESRGQLIAVALVILCGTATYIGIASSHRNLLLTRDSYYHQYQFADFTIMLDQAPRTAVHRLETVPGVRRARGRIVKDVTLDLGPEEEPRVGRIISMPPGGGSVINGIALLSGRHFELHSMNEVIVSKAFAEANGLEVGGRLEATIANRKHVLRIVGIALSPEYVYLIRSANEFIPSPERFGVLWVPDDFAEMAFDMGGACNDLVGLVDNPDELERILDDAENLLDAYGVFATVKREDQMSNRFLSDEIQGLEVTATITPAIFLSIAALILLVLLNRMVRFERTQIGLLKAYGYTTWEISAHYLKFALAVGLTGCLGGCLVGTWLAGQFVKIYVQFFEFPLLRAQIYPDMWARAFALTVVFAGAGALQALRRITRIDPAAAMRPEAPHFAHRTWTERIRPLWRRLPFAWRMIVRNVSRYRGRTLINIFGVMVSAGILIVGFFTSSAVQHMIDVQFKHIQREDVRITFEREQGKAAWHDVRRLPYVRASEPMLTYPFELRSGWRAKQVAITGVIPESRLMRVVDEQTRPMRIDGQGLYLDERIARELGVRSGSRLVMKPLMGRVESEREVVVTHVIKQYLGMGAYMELGALSRRLEEPFAMNAALVQTEPGRSRDLSRLLKDVSGVAAVDLKEDTIGSIERTMGEMMWVRDLMLLFFAGLIAFAIIYNSTVVSLLERQRELASLRVLGFTESEVGRVLYYENYLLGAAGLGAGLPFGCLLCYALVQAFETEMYRIPFYIEPSTLVYTSVTITVYIVLANLAVRRKISKLDMIEVLEARE